MRVDFYGDTDVGQIRQINEDAYLLLPEVGVCVVCDGMGGHAAGEVASGEARKVYATYFHGSPDQWLDELSFTDQDRLPTGAGHLIRATRLANRSIFNIASESDSARGMGTTLVSLAFDPGIVSICHVGDSRAYRFRNGQLERLTIDHSLAAELIAQNELTEEESKHFAERNVITRALGTRPEVDVDLRIEKTQPGDVFLTCSDGLCGFIEDELMERILKEAGTDYPAVVQNLLKAANATGGEDNITVALAVVVDPGTGDAESVGEARTIDAMAGPTGEKLDAIIPQLATVDIPDEDTERVTLEMPADTKSDDTPATQRSGSSGRLFRWLALMAIITAVIILGGRYLWPGGEDKSGSKETIVSELLTAEDLSAVFFEYQSSDLTTAHVYVDGDYQGLIGEYQTSGLQLRPGPRHIRCLFDSTTICDTVIQVTEDTIFLPLVAQAK